MKDQEMNRYFVLNQAILDEHHGLSAEADTDTWEKIQIRSDSLNHLQYFAEF